MAVSIVTYNSRAEPDHVCGAQILREDLLVVAFLHSGIALLHSADKALLGGDQRALSIYFNRATFEHHAILAERRPDFLCTCSLCHQAADFLVVLPVGIFGPRVEAPLEPNQF